jgi:hypothetical protein
MNFANSNEFSSSSGAAWVHTSYPASFVFPENELLPCVVLGTGVF